MAFCRAGFAGRRQRDALLGIQAGRTCVVAVRHQRAKGTPARVVLMSEAEALAAAQAERKTGALAKRLRVFLIDPAVAQLLHQLTLLADVIGRCHVPLDIPSPAPAASNHALPP